MAVEYESYCEVDAEQELMCYKCALAEINACGPMPKCLGRKIVFKKVDKNQNRVNNEG